MPTNWRDETNYDYIENLDASGLAWECLRRNPDYRAAFPNMTENEAAAWGLRFPRRSRAQGDGGEALLEAIHCTGRHNTDDGYGA
ncbi:DUF6499 domain-containing protein [uncultured Roseobacter sp.]|uniref:transcriptional regulator domain-containing protein n=1 Tax=uncultured Roseobacter sp. TaxID=114847 RepID=UPI00262840A2|nr:DUF6499 domain-containing protein [uncultured Roseobacter sp.]